MNEVTDRRQRTRRLLVKPCLGSMCPFDMVSSCAPRSRKPLFVELLDLSEGGALIESSRSIDPDSRWVLLFRDPDSSEMKQFEVRSVWINSGLNKGYLAGLEFMGSLPIDSFLESESRPCPKDMDFLSGMLLLDWVPRHALCDLLNSFQSEKYEAGKRIVAQGHLSDCLHIIQEGVCSVNIEKEGETLKVDRMHEGEIFGEMALIDSGLRFANVDAETDVVAWKLSKVAFEKIAERSPDLRGFLTELVANRFDSSMLPSAIRRIGKYLIKRKIGKGALSVVYEGVHETLGFPVAIKMIRHDLAYNNQFRERLMKEAQLIAGMNHRNIVHVYDVVELYGTIFIIMEYLKGFTLEGLLNMVGRLPVTRALNFIVQICSGLEYAHWIGIIHQDIRPANIFILPGDRVKVLDFGLSSSMVSEDMGFLDAVHYISPEQVLGLQVGPYTDMRALGITAYEMLTGAKPYQEKDLDSLLDLQVNADVPDPAERLPDLPAPLRQFISKAAARDIVQRYQCAEEALRELAPLARSLGCLTDVQIALQRKMTTILVTYSEDKELKFKRSLERFYLELRDLGISLKSADFDNI